MSENEVPGFDGVPASGKVGHDRHARGLSGFASRIDGGDDLFVEVCRHGRHDTWPVGMNAAGGHLGHQVGRDAVLDFNSIETKLLGSGSRRASSPRSITR